MPPSAIPTPRVLLVAPAAADRELLVALARRRPTAVPDVATAVAHAGLEPCILVATRGAEALALLGALGRSGRSAAVVLVSDAGDEALAADVLRAGAAACLPRRAALEGLLAALVEGLVAHAPAAEAPAATAVDPMLALHLRAEEHARLKAEIVANVSHELRTPLTSVIGYADILADQLAADPRDAHDVLRRLREQASRLHDVVASVVSLGRLHAAADPVSPACFSLRGLLEDLRADALVLNAQKRLELAWHEPAPPFEVVHDREKIRTVAYQLLSNAIKFTQAGRVEVGLGRTDGGGIRLSVRDTGIGLPAEAHAVIFEDFRQLDGSTSRRYEGLGIGLGLVKRYTALMRGTLEVGSTPGVGTTVTVELPAIVQ